jgi:hypothetical protein
MWWFRAGKVKETAAQDLLLMIFYTSPLPHIQASSLTEGASFTKAHARRGKCEEEVGDPNPPYVECPK